jgi:O-antigen/teichoic acid export membrane protein
LSGSSPGGAQPTTTAAASRSYASGARLLSIGIASTGVLTLAYFALAGHLLDRHGRASTQYSHLDVLWSVMFVIISVIYRPIEQLLSRTIADHHARGIASPPMRVPMTIQGSFALVFLAVALPLHDELARHVFASTTLYWIFVLAIVAYAASYFARGWLAGHRYFALYGGLVFMESASRMAFAIAAAAGITHGQSAIAVGIAAAPFVSLVVVPAAFASRAAREDRVPPTSDAALEGPAAEGVEEALSDLSIRRGSHFAVAVSGIQLAEQTLLNAAVLTIAASSGSGSRLPGVVFNVLLITRAPLQLFQAIQTSLLPHLAGLEATRGAAAFARAIRVTLLAIAAFAVAVAVGLLAVGPFVLHQLFHNAFPYSRYGLVLIAVGMGLHLSAGALNQAALARDRAAHAAALWLGAAALFVAWMVADVIADPILRTEVGYAGAAGMLAVALAALYRRGSPTASARAV